MDDRSRAAAPSAGAGGYGGRGGGLVADEPHLTEGALANAREAAALLQRHLVAELEEPLALLELPLEARQHPRAQRGRESPTGSCNQLRRCSA